MTPAESLTLELEQEFLRPVAPEYLSLWDSTTVRRWPPEALAQLPVYARSTPSWYGATYSTVFRWRTPVLHWEKGAFWVVGQYDGSGRITWEVADYGAGEVQPRVIARPAWGVGAMDGYLQGEMGHS